MSNAPYYHNVASGPGGGFAVWAKAEDGVRLRVALWPEGAKGTVVMFPGRTEYVEKYSDAAREFHQRGFASCAIDWRGQGLTERPKIDRMAGHVADYRDYQLDAAALIATLRQKGLPEPYHLLGHSMGGLIGLRSVLQDHPFETAAFSGPMWGLQMSPFRRIGAWIVSHVGHALGYGDRMIPASGKVADPAAAPFEGNLLTGDPEMFDWMKKQVAVHPDLPLGGPSISWVRTAFQEMQRLAVRPAPTVAAITFLGSDEKIVSASAIRTRMAEWSRGRLIEVPKGRHEVLMEVPDSRQMAFDTCTALFETGDA